MMGNTIIGKKIKRSAIILCLAVAVVAIGGGGARAAGMFDALTDAYKQNPDLLAKRAQLRSIDESLAEALSGYRPSVSVDGEAGIAKTDSSGGTFTAGDETLSPRAAAVTVKQPLFRGGRTLAASNQAEFDIKSGQADLMQTEQQVLLDAVTAYMDVLRDRSVVELNVGNKNVLDRQLKATEDRFSVGELSRTDIAQAESRLERAKAGLISAQGLLAASQTKFLKIIGYAPPSTMDDPPKILNLPSSRDEAIELAGKNNPQLLSAMFREKSAQEIVDKIRGEELPEVNLVGSASSSWEQVREGDQTDSASALVQLSFPFYQGGAVMARTRAAGETANQRRLEFVSAQRAVVDIAGRAWDDVATARANIDAFNAAIKAAEVALDGVRQEQDVGSRTVLDVLDAEQELLDAKVNLVRASRDHVVASYALLAAVGRLNAKDLNLGVEIYDPIAHYKSAKKTWFGY